MEMDGARRLRELFVSEGANVAHDHRGNGGERETFDRDAFGHVKLDKVNVGDWFSKRLAKLVGAERTLVQKSGFFAALAAQMPTTGADQRMAHLAVEFGFAASRG